MTTAAQQQERRAQIAVWTRCAWCWNPLGTAPYRLRGLPYCDERCAKRDVTIAEETSMPVAAEQLTLEEAR